MKKVFIITAIASLAPVIAFAQNAEPSTAFTDSVTTAIAGVIAALIPLVLALAVLLFIWGLVSYILKAGDPEGREGAKSQMIWGVIIIFVIVSLWGLVGILQNITGTDDAGDNVKKDITVPTLKTGA